MPSQTQALWVLPRTAYEKTSKDLLKLKATLPQDAVVSLAKAGLSRLASRVSDSITPSESVQALSHALIDPDSSRAADLMEELYQSGLTIQALYLGLLAPAARQLGEWWETDEINFADVTIGTGRIYGIMRILGQHLHNPVVPKNRTALVACVPGETHTLGVRMATDLLREQGWTIDMELTLDHDPLMARITDSDHLVIGFSAGGVHALPALAKLVIATRFSQPAAAILVSGNIVSEARDRIGLMGVDGMSESFSEASQMLDRLWASATSHPV